MKDKFFSLINMNLNNCISFYEFKKKYIVSDILSENLKIIFLLESPHKDEIRENLPAAGNTGKAMSKALIGNNKISFGEYLSKNFKKSIFGIMNCSPIPLQISAYSFRNIFKESQDIFSHFNTIRKTKITVNKRRNQETQDYEDAILQNLIARIKRINNLEDKIFIPCGKMAEYFLNKCSNELNIKIKKIDGVPHPSYQNWEKGKYQKKIKEIEDLIKKKNTEEINNG